MDRLAKMRPSPSHYIAHGTLPTIRDIYSRAKQRNLVKRDARWTFAFHDWKAQDFPMSQLDAQVVFMSMTPEDCCRVLNSQSGSCSCSSLKSPGPRFVEQAAILISQTFVALDSAGNLGQSSPLSCSVEKSDKSPALNFTKQLKESLPSSFSLMNDKMLLTYNLEMEVMSKNSSSSMKMGTWSTAKGFQKADGYTHR